MRVCVFSLLLSNETAMKYGLGRFLDVFTSALDVLGVEYIVTGNPRACRGYDLVHAHDLFDDWVVRELRRHSRYLVLHVHTFSDPELLKMVTDHVDAVVFVSKLQRGYYGYEKGYVLYNGIKPVPRYIRDRIYDFIFTSRRSGLKGVDWVEKQVKRYKVFKWVTTGGVNIEGALNKGYVSFNRLLELLASTRIHVLPSYLEAFGLSTLYAMAEGTAPAVTVHSGVSEILPDKLCIRFDPRVHDAMYIWKKYWDKNLYVKEEEIREFALSHDHRWYAENLRVLYERVAGRI